MEAIQNKSNPKDDKIAKPEVYLGSGLEEMTNDHGTECWSMSSEAYCKTAIKNVEDKLAKEVRQLPTNCHAPLK